MGWFNKNQQMTALLHLITFVTKLQKSQGDITLGDLFTYVEKQVVRTSLTGIRKSQTPSVAAGIDAQVWKERKL